MQSNKHKYTIDTCSLIELRRAYADDVFPAIWDRIGVLADNGVLISIEDVYEELKEHDDNVFKWAKKHSNMFFPLDGLIQTQASKILSTHQNLIDLKKRKSGADPFIIGTALVYSCGVVTEETPSHNPNRSKIPDVCKAYNIKCIRLLELLRLENIRVTAI